MTIIPFPGTQQGCDCSVPEWISLPVAPQAAARGRFSGEEKIPQAVPLRGALTWVSELRAKGKRFAGLCIDGPGDPLASISMTLEILTILHEQYPELSLGLKTLGIGLDGQIHQLADNGVEKVTLLVDGVNPKTIQNLYAWIRPGRKNIPLPKAADILIEEQAKGISACNKAGIDIFVQTTVYAGVNEMEVEEIASKVSRLGAESITLLPGKGWLPDNEMLQPLPVDAMDWLVMKAGQHIKSASLHIPKSGCDIIPMSGTEMVAVKPMLGKPNVAVLSSNGVDIDLHLGQAIKALIYGPREDGLACLLESRDLPEPGGGDTRWRQVAEVLDDCFTLLAASAGQKPQDILGRHGLPILLIEDNVEGTVDVLFGGGKKGKRKKI